MHFRTTSFPVCDNGTSGPRGRQEISPGCERWLVHDGARTPRAAVRWRSVVTDIRPLQVSAPYRRLFFGNTVAQLGQQMTNVAVAIQVYALTQSSFYVGLVGVFALVPLVALGLYGGAIADAMDRRTLALVASAGLWVGVDRAGGAGVLRATARSGSSTAASPCSRGSTRSTTRPAARWCRGCSTGS